ncbi:MAG: hypothetical protein ACK4JF_05500 [Methylohalobius sp.]
MSENPEKRIDSKDRLGISRRRLVKKAGLRFLSFFYGLTPES